VPIKILNRKNKSIYFETDRTRFGQHNNLSEHKPFPSWKNLQAKLIINTFVKKKETSPILLTK
jgi:hypothetical protein